MGLFDSLFGSSSESEGGGFVEIPQSAGQVSAEKFLRGLFESGAGPLQGVAGMGQLGQGALDMIQQLMQGLPQASQTGVEELTKYATGEAAADQARNPVLNAILNRAQSAGQDFFNQGQRQSNVGGMLASSPGANRAAKNTALISDAIMAAGMPFALQSEQQRFQSIPQLIEAGIGLPQRQIGLGMAGDEYQRGIQNQQSQALFNQQMFPWTTQAPIAQGVLGREAYAFDPGITQPSIFSQIAPVAGAVAMGAASDSRIKEDVKPIENALEKTQQLQGNTYNFIGKEGKDAGIMAQDLEKVLPEGVSEIGGIKHVKFNSILGLLVNAIKELSFKVATLERA